MQLLAGELRAVSGGFEGRRQPLGPQTVCRRELPGWQNQPQSTGTDGQRR